MNVLPSLFQELQRRVGKKIDEKRRGRGDGMVG